MRRRFGVVFLGAALVAGVYGALPAAAQPAAKPKMVILEFFERMA